MLFHSGRCRGGMLAVMLWATPASALEKVVVGQGGMAWSDALESAEFLNVAADSIWIWAVERNQNLAPQVLQRGGRIDIALVERHSFGADTRTFLSNEQAARMLDGDESTAFNPDEAGVSREAEIYLDLGNTYGISRVRFFPRLDSQHRGLFLQAFELGFNRGVTSVVVPSGLPELFFGFFINAPRFKLNDRSVVTWPRIDEVARSQQTRFVLIKPLIALPWEIAELELYSDGSVPPGVFTSRALSAQTRNPVWVQVRYPGQDISQLPLRIQTHTGPDDEPLHYFFHSGIDTDLRKVSQSVWEGFDDLPPGVEFTEQGPILPNPEWTPWKTITDGVIRSPAFKYLQFRLEILEPGTVVSELVFEYTDRPLAQVLEAEISPAVVDAAVETTFVLSLGIQRLSDVDLRESGFRQVQIDTPAEIGAVDSVRVNDRRVLYKARITGTGFSIKLWQRATPGRGFIQIFFRGRVFVDGTRFDVRALDIRSIDGVIDTVSQFASEGDVDVLSPGGRLAVRLGTQDDSLIKVARDRSRAVFTPNGDGINDVFALEFDLLRLTQPAPLLFEIFDLAGRLVSRSAGGNATSGRSIRTWDGRDAAGVLVAPGLYVYRIEVQADVNTESYQGLVGVAY